MKRTLEDGGWRDLVPNPSIFFQLSMTINGSRGVIWSLKTGKTLIRQPSDHHAMGIHATNFQIPIPYGSVGGVRSLLSSNITCYYLSSGALALQTASSWRCTLQWW